MFLKQFYTKQHVLLNIFLSIVWVKKNKNTKAPANVVNQYRVIDNKPTQKSIILD